MPSSDEKDPSIKSESLIYLMAIAGYADAQTKRFAQKLHDDENIYKAQAIVSSLSYCTGIFRFIDGFFSKDADRTHDFLTSTKGIAAVTAEAVSLMTLYFLANKYAKEKEDRLKKYIVKTQSIVQNVTNSLTNTFKGTRNSLQVLSQINHQNLKSIMLPAGLGLGVFSAANQIWLNNLRDKSKELEAANRKDITEIKLLHHLSAQDLKKYQERNKDNRLSTDERVYAYLSIAVISTFDGLYYYFDVSRLTIFSPQLLLASFVMGAVYTVCRVITNLYEEYLSQLALEATQYQAELGLISKQIELEYIELLRLKTQQQTEESIEKINTLEANISSLIGQLDTIRKSYKENITHSYFTAGLSGMKDGLFMYSVVGLSLFTTNLIFSISASAFSPVLAMVFVVSGVALMMGMSLYSLYNHHQEMQKCPIKSEKELSYDKLLGLKNNIDKGRDVEFLSEEELKKILEDSSIGYTPPKSDLTRLLETIRAYISGVYKGNRFGLFLLTFLQAKDPEGHYHNTSLMNRLTLLMSFIFALILGLRTLAREFSVTKSKKAQSEAGLGMDNTPGCANEPADMDKKADEFEALPKPEGIVGNSGTIVTPPRPEVSEGSSSLSQMEAPDAGLGMPSQAPVDQCPGTPAREPVSGPQVPADQKSLTQPPTVQRHWGFFSPSSERCFIPSKNEDNVASVSASPRRFGGLD